MNSSASGRSNVARSSRHPLSALSTPACTTIMRCPPKDSEPAMSLREQFTDQLKASMKAGNPARTSTLRMIMAKLKDIDIAARPKGVDKVPDDEVLAMLRGMGKSRRESVDLYRQCTRPDLVDKEEAKIAVIESFLPQQMDQAGMEAAVTAAIADTGAASI